MKSDRVVAKHYKWGQNCDGWHLLNSPELSIIHEKMPPDTSEERHYHQKALQFFFVVSGQAVLEIDGERIVLERQEGVEVAPNSRHRIYNESLKDVEFIVVSKPSAQGDRFNTEAVGS